MKIIIPRFPTNKKNAVSLETALKLFICRLFPITFCDKGKNSAAKAGGITGIHNPMISKCLGTIIRGTKARISHWAHQNNLSFGWQSNYHEHIIRDQNEMNRIADYIYENPQKWTEKSADNGNINN